MPFYEYNCSQCTTDFEEFIRCEADMENLHCPGCGSIEVDKKMSVFGLAAPSGKVVSSAPGGSASCSGCAKHSCAGCH